MHATGSITVVHHDRMHISPAEAALAGAAISAVASPFAAVTVQRYTGRTGHSARLWEQRVEAYEYALSDAEWWRELRTETMRAIQRYDIELVTPPDSVTDTAERRRLWARLQMFGEPDVRQAYQRSGEANKQFVVAVAAWRNAVDFNRLVEGGDVPDGRAVAAPELTGLKVAAEASVIHASFMHDQLVTVVHEAVGRIPRYERRRALPFGTFSGRAGKSGPGRERPQS